jgi:hypothetical protein
MIALRMNAPGLRSRYVDGGTDAVLAVAPCVLVVPPPPSAYRILTLGVTPKAAFFMGALWCVDGCWRACNQWLLILSAPVGIRSPYVRAAVKTCGAPQSIYENSRAGLSPLAVRLHGRLRVEHRCTCDSVRPLNQCQPEGLVSALHSITSKTGMPKVVGLYPPQVSGALISQKRANDKNAGRPLAGWRYSLEELTCK